jgi:biopolymer transport protein ExbB
MIHSFLLQITTTGAEAAGVAAKPDTSINFFELLLRGGWVMLPIGILSVVTLAVFIERFIAIRKAISINNQLFDAIREALVRQDLEGALRLCRNSNAISAKVLEIGVSRIGKSTADIERTMESAAGIELAKLEKGLGYLGIIAGVAPILGFIGTISGIIRIFYTISIENNFSIGGISGGLYEKMVTSFAGLLVGVVAFSGFHYLNILLDKMTLKLNTLIFDFINFLEEPHK